MGDLSLALHYRELALDPPVDERTVRIMDRKIETITFRILRIQERLKVEERGAVA